MAVMVDGGFSLKTPGKSGTSAQGPSRVRCATDCALSSEPTRDVRLKRSEAVRASVQTG